MALTAELVARALRVVERGELPADVTPTPEADFAALVAHLLDLRPRGQDVWLFAYGPLLWKPVVQHVAERPASTQGWHRSFCMRIKTFRGTEERPGLMMALDRGGRCRGMAFRLADETMEADLEALVRREMPVKRSDRPIYAPRWIGLTTPEGPLRAIAFVMNRQAANYAGRLTLEETAEILATACGYGGSCAEYLHNTITHLEARGIRDRTLWRLQALVAERLAWQGEVA